MDSIFKGKENSVEVQMIIKQGTKQWGSDPSL